jgi:hypothetical protein
MSLSIKDPEADRLARTLAQRTWESITQAVITALRGRLARERRKDEPIESLAEEVMDIAEETGWHRTKLLAGTAASSSSKRTVVVRAFGSARAYELLSAGCADTLQMVLLASTSCIARSC